MLGERPQALISTCCAKSSAWKGAHKLNLNPAKMEVRLLRYPNGLGVMNLPAAIGSVTRWKRGPGSCTFNSYPEEEISAGAICKSLQHPR